jgi:hypothetical protein
MYSGAACLPVEVLTCKGVANLAAAASGGDGLQTENTSQIGPLKLCMLC